MWALPLQKPAEPPSLTIKKAMSKRTPLRAAWIDGVWKENVSLLVDEHGQFEALEELKAGETGCDFLLPGFVSSHSHAFHRFFAGDGEQKGSGRQLGESDNFWSWRTAMYKEAALLDPDTYCKKAEVFFKELLSFGVTHLVEFHYVHHKKDGSPYAPVTELSEALLRSAKNAGIRLCLLPTYYNKGGFKQNIFPDQKRFYSANLASFLKLAKKTERLCKNYGQDFGIALHSLRAVDQKEIPQILGGLDPAIPVHIHVSEQQKEVYECLRIHGKKPIELFLSSANNKQNLFLIHATHADANELKLLKDKGANIIVCPTTEANLGDGVFPWDDFSSLADGSNLGFGTDANLSVSMWEELRTFEYSQRLLKRNRNIAAPAEHKSVADFLFASAWKTGMKNFSQNNYLQKGALFDGILVDGSCPTLAGSSLENTIPRLCFRSQSNDWLKKTWVRGKVQFAKKPAP